MRERLGPLGRVGQLARGVAATARRRQREREPRVAVYDAAGHATVLAPEDPAYGPLLETGSALIALRPTP